MKPKYDDADLQGGVELELRRELLLKGTQIDARVKDAVVTLSGEVASFLQCYAADRAVMRVPGIRALINKLAMKTTMKE